MVTLWNDMRLAYGMPPMGFIAPFLYYAQSVAPDAFQDVTTGNNVSSRFASHPGPCLLLSAYFVCPDGAFF
jgi:hypothetical protein